MEDIIDPIAGCGHGGFIAEIGFAEVDAVVERADAAAEAGGEIVDGTNFNIGSTNFNIGCADYIAAIDEGEGDGGADKSRCTGNKIDCHIY